MQKMMYLLVSQHVSGIIMPIIRRMVKKTDNAYGVQHCKINPCPKSLVEPDGGCGFVQFFSSGSGT
jgi:hypothetical protein